jgi:hypothetical protein
LFFEAFEYLGVLPLLVLPSSSELVVLEVARLFHCETSLISNAGRSSRSLFGAFVAALYSAFSGSFVFLSP